MASNLVNHKNLNELISQKAKSVLETFTIEIGSGIENPRLSDVIKHVKNNALDVYRPALIAFSCEAVGGKAEDTDIVSLMISLAGAGIGIHDDIIDNSKTKGFRRTILGRYGLNDALLVGDLLIVKGLTAVHQLLEKGYDPKEIAEIITIFQRHYIEICEGVFMENEWKKNVSIDLDYCHKILWKFSSDGEACTKLGAILGNGNEKEVEALAEYGRRLCYIFRLAEEVKDTVNLKGGLLRRLEYESIPIPILFAAQVSEENSVKIESILGKQVSLSDIEVLIELCFETNAFDYIYEIAKEKIQEGIKLLQRLKSSQSRKVLKLMINDTFPDSLTKTWKSAV